MNDERSGRHVGAWSSERRARRGVVASPSPRRHHGAAGQHRGAEEEAEHPFFRVVELDRRDVDPAIWGKNFPLQYDGYLRRSTAADALRRQRGVPRSPTDADPRSVVSQSQLEEDPQLKTMWAGYAFAVDFREERGHAYMLEDQTFTERVQDFKQPGTCIHCHASVYVPYKKAGERRSDQGFEKLNQMPYAEARKHVTHPVACIDCHDPKTMALRVTRPGFIEGHPRAEGEPGRRATTTSNTMATRQEMRIFVCGQCHVEYYFKGKEKRLTYPVGQGPEGRRNPRVLRRSRLQGLDARRDRRAGAQGPAPGVRDVEPGHPCPLRRCLRRLPHALHARRRARRSATTTSAARC